MLAAASKPLRLRHATQQSAASVAVPSCVRGHLRSRRQLSDKGAGLQTVMMSPTRADVSTCAMGFTAEVVASIASISSSVPVLPVALLGAAGLLSLAAYLDARRNTELPTIQYPSASPVDTQFHKAIIDRCPSLTSLYRPVPFLTNCHVETIFAAKCRNSTTVDYIRECLLMPDGGCVALDWEHKWEPDQALPEDAPVLILLPGLTGGSHDTYVMYAVKRAAAAGFRAMVFNSRATSDSPVTTPQYYSASFTGDLRAVVAHVHNRYPKALMLAAGWSLGANILVRYLGEEGAATPLAAAVSMANPFELTISNAKLQKGFSQLYDRNLAQSLSRLHKKHFKLWAGMGGKFNPEAAATCKTIYEFDDAITIHSFGWPSVKEYYAGSSSSLSIPAVKIPLLCIQALDDPIAPNEAIPYQALASNPMTVLVTTPCGGHLGWCCTDNGAANEPWTDAPMVEWLVSVLRELKSRGPPAQKPVEPIATVLGPPALEKARSMSPGGRAERVQVNAVADGTFQASVSVHSPAETSRLASPGADVAGVQGSSSTGGVQRTAEPCSTSPSAPWLHEDSYSEWKARQMAETDVVLPRVTAAGTLTTDGIVPPPQALGSSGAPTIAPTTAVGVSALVSEPTTQPQGTTTTTTTPQGSPQSPSSPTRALADSLDRPSLSNLVNNLLLVVRSPLKQQQQEGAPPPAPA